MLITHFERAAGLRRLGVVILAMLVVACGATPAPTPDPISGSYTASGGGGALPAVQALAARFVELHPNVKLKVVESGSNAAIKLLQSNTIDIGFVSRALTDTEKEIVTPVGIGFSGTAVVVNATNPVAGLDREQLRNVYGGLVTNWLELGGPDAAIRAYIREPNAATRQNFESYLFARTPPVYGKAVTEMFEVEAILTAVASFRGGIGIASTGSRTAADPKLKMLAIDGVAPTQENVAGGKYPIVRPLFLVTLADPSAVKPAVKAFLEFAKSPEGQRIAAGAF